MEKEKAQHLFGIILSGGGNLLGMAASLVTIMVAARLLSQDELGAYFLVMVVVQFTAIFGDIGLKNTAIKTLSLLPVESTDFIQTSRYLLTVTLTTSLIACLAVTLFMPFLMTLWPYQEFQSHTSYIAPIALLTTGLQLVMSLLVGAKKFKRLSVLSAGTEIFRALLSTGGLLAGLGISSLLWGMIVSRLIGIGAIWVSMPSLFAITFRHPQSAALLKFGGWLYGCSLVSIIMVRASDAILTTYMGTAALAVYSAAMQVPSVLQRVFESIRPALLGYISAQQTAYANPQILAVRIVTAFLAVAATFLIALSRPIMTLLYSEKYESGVTIMQALSVWAVFTIINYLFSIILIGNGQSRRAFLLTLPQLLLVQPSH
jgi:O-antigen/teichoic acid export membrane protein